MSRFCHGHCPVISTCSEKLRKVRMRTITASIATLVRLGEAATVRTMSPATSSSRPSRIAWPSRWRSRRVRPGQHEIYVTTATQPGWNQPDQPAPAARLGWVSGKDKRYLMSWVWLGCSAIALVLVLWAKHVA